MVLRMMGDFKLFIAFCYALNLAVFAEASLFGWLAEPNDATDELLNQNKSLAETSDVRAVTEIRLSIQPAWKIHWVVFSQDREIDVLAGEGITEKGLALDLYKKYFEGTAIQKMEFHGNEIAIFSTQRRDHSMSATLEISPLEPGTYRFGYSIIRDNVKDQRWWTVNSIPTQTIPRDSFFKFALNFSEISIAKDAMTLNLKNIGVEVGSEPGTLEVYGLADDIKNGSILVIQIHHADSTITTRKVRLLLQERDGSQTQCRNIRKPCVRKIQLWLKNFAMKIENQRNLARCMLNIYKLDESDLSGVIFEDHGSEVTYFEAQPRNFYVCSLLDTVPKTFIRECHSQEVIGYRLSCGQGEKMVEFQPPLSVLPRTTTQTSLEMNTIDDGPREVSVRRLTGISTTESSLAVETLQTQSETSSKPPSTAGPEPVQTSSTTSEVLREPSSTAAPTPATTPSTTPSIPPEPTTTTSPEPKRSSTIPTLIMPEPSSTVSPVPDENASTTPRDSSGLSYAIKLDADKVSKDGSNVQSSTALPDHAPTTTAGPTSHTVLPPTVRGDLGTTEVNPSLPGPSPQVDSVTAHLSFYAILGVAVFIVLFFLVVCMSR